MKTERPRAKLTAKGQVTLPPAVLERLQLEPGDYIEFVETDEGFTVRKGFSPKGLLKYQGYLKHLAGRDPDDIVNEMRGR